MSSPQDAFDRFVHAHPSDWPDRLDEARILLIREGFVFTSSAQMDVTRRLACDALVALGLARPDRRLVHGAHDTGIYADGVAVVDEDTLRRFETRAGSPEAVRRNAAT